MNKISEIDNLIDTMILVDDNDVDEEIFFDIDFDQPGGIGNETK